MAEAPERIAIVAVNCAVVRSRRQADGLVKT
jgi:hypothetical protein